MPVFKQVLIIYILYAIYWAGNERMGVHWWGKQGSKWSKQNSSQCVFSTVHKIHPHKYQKKMNNQRITRSRKSEQSNMVVGRKTQKQNKDTSNNCQQQTRKNKKESPTSERRTTHSKVTTTRNKLSTNKNGAN